MVKQNEANNAKYAATTNTSTASAKMMIQFIT